ncbi:hypothetical protein TRVL_09847 [Trypanosoma vivax]|uniref:Uncharacterized protein n=1 Tax=Trypanosoma vivax (strain Y486) TaxID=1055687 RepID=G0TZW7_TRYVY|nr:hypothetical protein TRVL_09847 [Trypanosoma vivax]CCC50145.1 hypothetical protein, unlikely [Trypanosoma vivax Y486]
MWGTAVQHAPERRPTTCRPCGWWEQAGSGPRKLKSMPIPACCARLQAGTSSRETIPEKSGHLCAVSLARYSTFPTARGVKYRANQILVLKTVPALMTHFNYVRVHLSPPPFRPSCPAIALIFCVKTWTSTRPKRKAHVGAQL